MSFQNIIAGAVKDHFNQDSGHSGNQGGNQFDLNGAASHASTHSSEDSSLFSQALKFVQERNSGSDHDVDEEHAVNSHQRYEQGGNMDSRDMGAGAAMQALKMFNSGSSGASGGGQDKNAFIGLAMAQASKMWEEKNGKGEAVSIILPSLPTDVLFL